MPNISAECPLCSADVPLDTNQEDGGEVYCSYCKAPLVARKVDRYTWMLRDIDDDRKSANRKAAKKAERDSEEEGVARSMLDEFEFNSGGGGGRGGH